MTDGYTVLGDLKFFYEASNASNLGPADVKIDEENLLRDAGFETAVLCSLFSDRRADDGDAIPGTNTVRSGYFGSLLTGFNIGSKGWLLDRAKLDNNSLRLLEQYYKDSLSWMKDDGIVSEFSVTATRSTVRKDQINFEIIFYRRQPDKVFFNFYINWEYQTIGGLPQ